MMYKMNNKNNQHGAVMITVLILSMVLTVAVMSQMNIILLNEKIVANQKYRQVGFQASEAAIREAEEWLENEAFSPLPADSDQVLSLMEGEEGHDINQWALHKDSDWWKSNGISALTDLSKLPDVDGDGVNDLPNIDDDNYRPRYIMEYYAYVQDSLVTGQQRDEQGRNFYRITTRGFGGSDSARVTLQTTYSRR